MVIGGWRGFRGLVRFEAWVRCGVGLARSKNVTGRSGEVLYHFRCEGQGRARRFMGSLKEVRDRSKV